MAYALPLTLLAAIHSLRITVTGLSAVVTQRMTQTQKMLGVL